MLRSIRSALRAAAATSAAATSALATSALALLLAAPGARADAAAPTLERLGAPFTIPGNLLIAGDAFGGISALDYDPDSQTFYALSDDRAERGPTRLYELVLLVTEGGIRRVNIRRMRPILDAAGAAAPPRTLDPEALRLAPGGGFVWANERDRETGGAPFIGRLSPPGPEDALREIRRFAPPEHYRPRFEGDARVAGVRENQGFESLTFVTDAASPDAGRLVAGLEGPLVGDGPPPSLAAGAVARVLTLDPDSGAALAERLYPLDPIVAAPIPPDGFALAGLVELLSLPEALGGGLLALERSFSAGQGHVAKIFHTRLDSGEDVLGRADIADARRMRKRLLHTLAAGDRGPPRVFNVEAMSFGPLLDGAQTLILASDDNLQPREATQFFAFRISPPSGP